MHKEEIVFAIVVSRDYVVLFALFVFMRFMKIYGRFLRLWYLNVEQVSHNMFSFLTHEREYPLLTHESLAHSRTGISVHKNGDENVINLIPAQKKRYQ